MVKSYADRSSLTKLSDGGPGLDITSAGFGEVAGAISFYSDHYSGTSVQGEAALAVGFTDFNTQSCSAANFSDDRRISTKDSYLANIKGSTIKGSFDATRITDGIRISPNDNTDQYYYVNTLLLGDVDVLVSIWDADDSIPVSWPTGFKPDIILGHSVGLPRADWDDGSQANSLLSFGMAERNSGLQTASCTYRVLTDAFTDTRSNAFLCQTTTSNTWTVAVDRWLPNGVELVSTGTVGGDWVCLMAIGLRGKRSWLDLNYTPDTATTKTIDGVGQTPTGGIGIGFPTATSSFSAISFDANIAYGIFDSSLSQYSMSVSHDGGSEVGSLSSTNLFSLPYSSDVTTKEYVVDIDSVNSDGFVLDKVDNGDADTNCIALLTWSEEQCSHNKELGQGDQTAPASLKRYYKMQDDAADTVVADDTGIDDGTLLGLNDTADISDTGPNDWMPKSLFFEDVAGTSGIELNDFADYLDGERSASFSFWTRPSGSGYAGGDTIIGNTISSSSGFFGTFDIYQTGPNYEEFTVQVRGEGGSSYPTTSGDVIETGVWNMTTLSRPNHDNYWHGFKNKDEKIVWSSAQDFSGPFRTGYASDYTPVIAHSRNHHAVGPNGYFTGNLAGLVIHSSYIGAGLNQLYYDGPEPYAITDPTISGTVQRGEKITLNAGTWLNAGHGTLTYHYELYSYSDSAGTADEKIIYRRSSTSTSVPCLLRYASIESKYLKLRVTCSNSHTKQNEPAESSLSSAVSSGSDGSTATFNKLYGAGCHQYDEDMNVFALLDSDAISDPDDNPRIESGMINNISSWYSGTAISGIATGDDISWFPSNVIDWTSSNRAIRIRNPLIDLTSSASQHWTLVSWVSPVASADGNQHILSLGNYGDTDHYISLGIAGSDHTRTVRGYAHTDFGTEDQTSTTTFTENQFHQVAAYFDFSLNDMGLSADGEAWEDINVTLSQAAIDPDLTQITFGATSDSSPSYSNVRQSHAAVFFRILTDTEISESYDGPEPTCLINPVMTGTAEEGKILTSTSGTWSTDERYNNNGTITISYQWTRSDSVDGLNETDIVGATNSTYHIDYEDIGKFVRCRVRGTNDGGFDADEDVLTGMTDYIKKDFGNINFKVGTFDFPASDASDVSVTGVGFKPKVVLFTYNKSTADGLSDNADWSMFATDGTNQAGATVRAEHDLTTSDVGGQSSAIRTILQNNYSGSTTIGAVIVSLDYDGFTIDPTNSTGSTEKIGYIAIGGSALEDVHVGQFSADETSTGNASYTGVGFKADGYLFFGTRSTDAGPNVGAWDGTNSWWSVSYSEDNKAVTESAHYQSSGYIFGGLNASGLFVRVSPVSIDDDGFTVNYDTVAGTSFPSITYVAIKGPEINAGIDTQRLSTGIKTISGIDMNAKGLILSSVGAVNSSTVDPETHHSSGASDGTNELALWYSDEDAADPTNTERAWDTASALQFYTQNGVSATTLDAEANVILTNDSFSLDWTTADATAREFGYLAIGEKINVTSYNKLLNQGNRTGEVDCRGFWPLQETTGTTAFDQSGNSEDLTSSFVTNPDTAVGPTQFLTSAYQFSSANTDDVSSTVPNGLDNLDSFTFGGWVYFDSIPGSLGRIVEIGTQDFIIYGDNLSQTTVSLEGNTYTSVSTFSTGQWYFIIGRYDGTNLEAVVDGSIWSSDEVAATLVTASDNFYLANRPAGDRPLDGRLAGMVGFSRSLNDVEIDELIAGPEPYKTGGTVQILGTPSRGNKVTLDFGTWDSQSNGDITYHYKIWSFSDTSGGDPKVEKRGSTILTSPEVYLRNDYLDGRYLKLQVIAENDGGIDYEEIYESAYLAVETQFIEQNGLFASWSATTENGYTDRVSTNDLTANGTVVILDDPSDDGLRSFDFNSVNADGALNLDSYTMHDMNTLSAWSINIWYKWELNASRDQYFYSFETSGTRKLFNVINTSNSRHLKIEFTGTSGSTVSSTGLNALPDDNEWHMLTITGEDITDVPSAMDSWKMFIDGSQVGATFSSAMIDTAITTPGTFCLGNDRRDYGNAWDGVIDTVRVYHDVALSTGQMTTLLNAGRDEGEVGDFELSYNQLVGLGKHIHDKNLLAYFDIRPDVWYYNYNDLDIISDKSRGGFDATILGGDSFGDRSVAGPGDWASQAHNHGGIRTTASLVPHTEDWSNRLDGDISFAVWCRNTDTQHSGTAFLLKDETIASQKWIAITINSNDRLSFTVDDNSTKTSVTGLSDIDTDYTNGTWLHYGYIREAGTEMNVYINSVVDTNIATDNTNGSIYNTFDTLVFGGDSISTSEGNDDGFNQSADYTLFDRVISQSELTELYSGPEPVNITAPVIVGDDYVGGSADVRKGTWDSQGNGQMYHTFTWYYADDTDGTNLTQFHTGIETSVIIPGAAQNKYITVVERVDNDGGYDAAEDTMAVYTAIIQANSYNALFGKGNHTADSSLISHWEMQDDTSNTDVLDDNGNYDGTLTGDDTGNTSGSSVTGPNSWLAKALNFDGDFDRVSLGNISDFDFGTASEFSIGAWVKPSSTLTQGYIWSKIDDSLGEGVGLWYDGDTNNIVHITSANSSSNGAQSTAVFTDTSWQHVSVSSKTSVGRFYKDGVFLNTDTYVASADAATENSAFIGARDGSGNNSRDFDGDIAGVYVFSKQLSDTQVAEIYSGPEPYKTGGTVQITGTIQLGETITLDFGTWDSQSNGDILYHYNVYSYSDSAGTTDKQLEKHGISPTSTQEVIPRNSHLVGRYLQIEVMAENDGGIDLLEVYTSAVSSIVLTGTEQVFADSYNQFFGRGKHIMDENIICYYPCQDFFHLRTTYEDKSRYGRHANLKDAWVTGLTVGSGPDSGGGWMSISNYTNDNTVEAQFINKPHLTPIIPDSNDNGDFSFGGWVRLQSGNGTAFAISSTDSGHGTAISYISRAHATLKRTGNPNAYSTNPDGGGINWDNAIVSKPDASTPTYWWDGSTVAGGNFAYNLGSRDEITMGYVDDCNLAELWYSLSTTSTDLADEIYDGPEPLNLTIPSILGTIEVGSMVSASPGTWYNQNNGTVLTAYEWYYADDTDGTNLTSFGTGVLATIPAGAAGKYIVVEEKGSNDGGTDEAENTFSAYSIQVPDTGVTAIYSVVLGNLLAVQNSEGINLGNISEIDSQDIIAVENIAPIEKTEDINLSNISSLESAFNINNSNISEIEDSENVTLENLSELDKLDDVLVENISNLSGTDDIAVSNIQEIEDQSEINNSNLSNIEDSEDINLSNTGELENTDTITNENVLGISGTDDVSLENIGNIDPLVDEIPLSNIALFSAQPELNNSYVSELGIINSVNLSNTLDIQRADIVNLSNISNISYSDDILIENKGMEVINAIGDLIIENRGELEVSKDVNLGNILEIENIDIINVSNVLAVDLLQVVPLSNISNIIYVDEILIENKGMAIITALGDITVENRGEFEILRDINLGNVSGITVSQDINTSSLCSFSYNYDIPVSNMGTIQALKDVNLSFIGQVSSDSELVVGFTSSLSSVVQEMALSFSGQIESIQDITIESISGLNSIQDITLEIYGDLQSTSPSFIWILQPRTRGWDSVARKTVWCNINRGKDWTHSNKK